MLILVTCKLIHIAHKLWTSYDHNVQILSVHCPNSSTVKFTIKNISNQGIQNPQESFTSESDDVLDNLCKR